MSRIRERIQFYIGRIRAGRLQEMWKQTLWIYGYAKAYWPAMVFYTLLGLVGSGLTILTGTVSRDMVDMITEHRTHELVRVFGTMAGVAVGNILFSQLTGYASTWISLRVNQEIQSNFFERILVTDWEALSEYHTGDLLSRWNSDAAVISGGILNWLPNLIIYVFRFVSVFAVVAHQDITFALLALMGIPFSFLMSRTLLRRMQDNNKRSAEMGARMSGFHQETFANIQTIKSFGMVRLYTDRLKELQKKYLDMRMEFSRMSIVTSVLLGIIGLIVSYLSYGWGIYRVWSGAITYGTMTMFLSLSGSLTGTVNSLAGMVPAAISLTTSAGRLMDVLEMPKEDYSGLDEAEEFLEKHREKGISLIIDSVDYAYQTGTQVFAGASLEAHPHEIIGLVGPSGEGKTTLLRLILALLRPEAGKAWLESGGERLMLTPASRQLFSYVPQGNTMLSGTIAENMRNVKPDATDEEIEEVLRMACAWDFVSRLKKGIYSRVKERGGGFSEGQAQRLSIARALLRRAPILLLDEASSALDVKTERRVLKNIMVSSYPRVCIVTTHRPSALEMCNRVYAIRDRRCVALDREEIQRLLEEF